MKSSKKEISKEKKNEKVKKVEKKGELVKKDNKKEKTEKNTKIKKDPFFKNVIKELKKVKWPDKKYMVKYSIATFVTIILSSVYFYVIFVLFSLVKGLRDRKSVV